ncbi:hypothetical protein BO79DRAFT_217323 [Aspergillus costaricaensis CBS 115574]|uniref:Uncharacterized protein n=1 Tax=Aspergillus costaricaensis CBS 115574 TaxID=1448317 RepID=A0ACD1IFQ1_9EURO|nr:hypothetical protein BO79DRAFT_217323 [Aspergillus costaricaensis CBS 115574]RAK89245.1 hypothetical protein BO79DRAFT_217323 [Aspergillus costaricaensis CBS 115574]
MLDNVQQTKQCVMQFQSGTAKLELVDELPSPPWYKRTSIVFKTNGLSWSSRPMASSYMSHNIKETRVHSASMNLSLAHPFSGRYSNKTDSNSMDSSEIDSVSADPILNDIMLYQRSRGFLGGVIVPKNMDYKVAMQSHKRCSISCTVWQAKPNAIHVY